jgi:hypothetical protein
MIRLFAIFAAALVIPFAAGKAFGQAAYVHDMSGSVTATENSASRQLRTGDILSAGTTVSTGDRSRAVIKFEDGQIMSLAERSSFRIVEYRYSKERPREGNAVFALLQGGLRFITGVIGSTNRNAFRLTAGTATIGIRGSDISVVFNQIAQTVTVAVAAGEASITTAQGVQIVSAGDISVAPTAAIQQVLDALAAQGVPINTPVVVAASAAAAFAAAEAARLGTPAAIAEAQRLLAIAIAAAQEAYQTALDNGAVPPDTSTTTSSGTPYGPPNPSVGQGGGGGTCTKFSVSPC